MSPVGTGPGPAARATAALAAGALVLAGTGCGHAGRSGPDARGGARASAGPETPPAPVAVPPTDAWKLSGLAPPAGAETLSSVRRGDPDVLDSYLVILTAAPEAARALCDEVGNHGPVGPDGFGPDDLEGWGLTVAPPGDLRVCRASEVGDYDVQRDVLLAEQPGTTTVWLSTYRFPR